MFLGLCGGVNSILTRMTRQMMQRLDAAGKKSDLLVLGEKGRAQLRRAFASRIVASATDRQAPYNFDLACALTQEVGYCINTTRYISVYM